MKHAYALCVLYREHAVHADAFEAVNTVGQPMQGGRGDFETLGVRTPGGALTVEIDASHDPQDGWYVVVGGQQFRVDGVEPVPPYFNRIKLTCTRNTDTVRVIEPLTIGGQSLTIGNDPITLPVDKRLGT